ncbi:MAG TPA: hypothetical protein VLT33_12135 [Labilithrix sp.]|nr:hypothetical protein [Labilithrix sp.]
MKLRAGLVGLAMVVLGSTGDAQAALTSSERGQIRDFMARGQAENAGRVRSLVARTDLTVDESVAALTEALVPVPFTEPRAVFLRELVFGVSSASARPLLAQAVVRALLARADGVFTKYVGGLDHEPAAIAELAAIYTFIDGTIANAGRPTAAAHDASAGISAAAYDEASKALRDHLERNARWLKGEGVVPESVGRLRAQAQVALLDMLPDGLTRRVDAVDRLGLTGARRQMLIEWGILLQDAGKLDAAKAERVRQILTRLPGARVDLELLYAGEDRGALRARGLVAHAGAAAGDANPFGDELTPVTLDAATAGITQELALLAVKRSLDSRAELRLQAERDATAAQGDPGRMLGKPRAPSVEHVTAAAAQLLLLDAPRALDLAFVRLIAGRPESAALLSDAVGALASFAATSAPAPDAKPDPRGLSVELGKSGGAAVTTMSAVRLGPSGAAIGFTLDGHTWSVDRPAPSFAVTLVTRDGQPVALAHLATARTPLREGSSWTEAGLSFSKLRGAPRVGIVTPADKAGLPTVKLVGSGPRGFDAVATAAPADDFVIEGELTVRGAAGGVLFRATNGRDAVRGAMLLVTPGGRASLVSSDDTGGESLLASPIDPAPAMPAHVKITVKGLKVEAILGTSTLSGTLPADLMRGEVGLIAKRGGGVDLAGFSLKKK